MARKRMTDADRLKAAKIVAEMMFHIGRGYGAASAGATQDRIDILANSASQMLPTEVFSTMYSWFHPKTSRSIVDGRVNTRTWSRGIQRDNVLKCSVHMGQVARKNHGSELGGRNPLKPAVLKNAKNVTRNRFCPPTSRTTHGGGDTCA